MRHDRGCASRANVHSGKSTSQRKHGILVRMSARAVAQHKVKSTSQSIYLRISRRHKQPLQNNAKQVIEAGGLSHSTGSSALLPIARQSTQQCRQNTGRKERRWRKVDSKPSINAQVQGDDNVQPRPIWLTTTQAANTAHSRQWNALRACGFLVNVERGIAGRRGIITNFT